MGGAHPNANSSSPGRNRLLCFPDPLHAGRARAHAGREGPQEGAAAARECWGVAGWDLASFPGMSRGTICRRVCLPSCLRSAVGLAPGERNITRCRDRRCGAGGRPADSGVREGWEGGTPAPNTAGHAKLRRERSSMLGRVAGKTLSLLSLSHTTPNPFKAGMYLLKGGGRVPQFG